MNAEQLRKIEQISNRKFVMVNNGIVTKLSGEVIDLKYIAYWDKLQKGNLRGIRPDGFYELTEATCSSTSGCEIGMPPQKCLDSGCYSKQKCCMYYIDKIGSAIIDISTLCGIL